MRLRFSHENIRLVEMYNGKDDPRENLSHWTMAWGEEPQPEWVHIFFHTLDVIPMNLYLKTELRHSTTDWYSLKERFILTFSFEYGCQCIDASLQEIKESIFWIPNEPTNWVQHDWNA